MQMKKILIILFFILFIFQGFGLGYIDKLFLFAYAVIPAALYIYCFITKKEIYFPRLATIFFGLYSFILILSLVFSSVDKQTSLEFLILHIVSFFLFIFFSSIRLNEAKTFYGLVFAGLVFSIYAVILYLNTVIHFSQKLIPSSAYQFVFSGSGNHNHLGDFLGLVFVGYLYLLFSKRIKPILWALFIVFIPLFVVSFSRSAWFSLISVTILMYFLPTKINWRKKAIILAVILMSTIALFLITSKEFWTSINRHPPSYAKTTTSRLSYWRESIDIFLSKPILGYGAGNYIYGAQKYTTDINTITATAHNIFIEQLVDGGIFGLFSFTMLFIVLLHGILQKRNLFFYLSAYLFINFLTDYTYNIPAFWALFMIILSQIYSEKQKIKQGEIILGISSIIFSLICICLLTSNILLICQKPVTALLWYPWNKKAYEMALEQAKNKDNAIMLAKKYSAIGSDNQEILIYLSDYFSNRNDPQDAYFYLNKAYILNRLIDFSHIKKLYYLKKNLYGQQEAGKFLLQAVNTYKKSYFVSEIQSNQIQNFCVSERISGCRFKYFYELKSDELRQPNPQIPFSTVTNKMNNDGLNSSQNFSIQKPKGVFRIMALGGSETYGIYVKTQDNWPEQLEKILNQKLLCPNIRKFEVINLAVDGDDLSYSIERYKLRGEKYNPDFIVLFVPNLYQLNEILLPKIAAYDQEGIHNKNYVREVAKGNLYPAWTLAMWDLSKEMNGLSVLKQQSGYLNDLYNTYKGSVLLLSYDYLSQNDQRFLQESLKNQPNSSVFLIHNIQGNKKYQLPDGNLNKDGYAAVAKQIYEEITQSFNVCHVQ